MKKIVVSLSIIAVAAAIAIGGTVAYFSDVETSVGNTFTAGDLDLTIDNECYYNGYPCICDGEGCLWDGGPFVDEECYCTWEYTDLNEELFFDFYDMKPGDWGEDTVSLHVTNDAWVCVAFENLSDVDNSCTEPEQEAEEGYCFDPDGEGELAQNLFFVFWADDGDNIFEYYDGEYVLMDGWADEIIPGEVYALADSENENVFTGEIEPLEGSVDYYIGKAWCFGEMDGLPFYLGGEIVCDGQYVGNEPQTDSLTGDIIFYAEQARNNLNFNCADWWYQD